MYYKGKPLLAFGQNIKLFDTTFSFRYDPNGSYQNFHRQGITDYLSLDDFYSTKLSTGTIDGAMYFSTNREKRIFKLKASFYIDAELVDTSGMVIMNYLHDKYFPCLPPDFKGRQTFELTHKTLSSNFAYTHRQTVQTLNMVLRLIGLLTIHLNRPRKTACKQIRLRRARSANDEALVVRNRRAGIVFIMGISILRKRISVGHAVSGSDRKDIVCLSSRIFYFLHPEFKRFFRFLMHNFTFFR